MVTFLVALLACNSGTIAVDPNDSGADTAPDSAETGGDTSETGDSGETGDTAHAGTDLDGDGFESEASGGDDCDDNNEFRYPGAVEFCDGMDHDCDGVPNDGARCSDWPDPVEMFPSRFADLDGLAWIDDVTGDGLADLNMYEAHTGAEDLRSQHIVPGPFEWQGAKLPADVAVLTLLWQGGSYCGPSGSTNAGDVDGDGLSDIVLPSQSLCDPGSAILLAPFPTDGRSVSISAEMDEEWAPVDAAVMPDVWAQSTARGDLNGDERQDAVFNGDGEAWIFYGGAWSTKTASNGTYVPNISAITSGDDLDGDGLGDLVADSNGEGGNAEGVYVISGEDVVPGTLSLADSAQGWIAEAASWEELRSLTGVGMRAPGADGYGLLRVNAFFSRSGADHERETLYFSARLVGEHVAYDAIGGFTTAFGVGLDSADFDGDGIPEQFASVWDPAVEQYGNCVLPGDTETPDAILTPLPARKWCLGFHDGWVSAAPGPDATGDRRGDLWLAWSPDHDPWGTVYARGFLPGFAIPWDEPEYWN